MPEKLPPCHLCNFSCFEMSCIQTCHRKRPSFITSRGPWMLDIFHERPFGKINYRNMLWCLITGESYHIAQGGFWGNSVAINQSGIISQEIVVSMQISVTFRTLPACTHQENWKTSGKQCSTSGECAHTAHADV